MRYKSGFRYDKPSFLLGLARILDLGNTLRGPDFVDEYANNGAEADAAAIRRDWEMVGQDIAGAMWQFETEHTNEINPSVRL